MKRRRIIVGATLAIGLLFTWLSLSGYRRGQIDYDAVRDGKEPVHAKVWSGYLDGGTESWMGRGYTVYKMQQFLRTRDSDEMGYLGGAKLEWWFPLNVFLSNYEDYHYIPPDV